MPKRPIGDRVPWWFCAVLALLAPAIVFGVIRYMSAGDDYVPLTRRGEVDAAVNVAPGP